MKLLSRLCFLLLASCSTFEKMLPENRQLIKEEKKSNVQKDKEDYRFLRSVRRLETSLEGLLDELITTTNEIGEEIGNRYVERPPAKDGLEVFIRLFPNAMGSTLLRSSSYGFDEENAFNQFVSGNAEESPNRFSAFDSISAFRLQPPLGKDKWHVRISPSFKYYNAEFTDFIHFRFIHAALMAKLQYDLPKYASISFGVGAGPMWLDGKFNEFRETKIHLFVPMFKADIYHYFTKHLVAGISHSHHILLDDNYKTSNGIEIENFFETGIFVAFAYNVLTPYK